MAVSRTDEVEIAVCLVQEVQGLGLRLELPVNGRVKVEAETGCGEASTIRQVETDRQFVPTLYDCHHEAPILRQLCDGHGPRLVLQKGQPEITEELRIGRVRGVKECDLTLG